MCQCRGGTAPASKRQERNERAPDSQAPDARTRTTRWSEGTDPHGPCHQVAEGRCRSRAMPVCASFLPRFGLIETGSVETTRERRVNAKKLADLVESREKRGRGGPKGSSNPNHTPRHVRSTGSHLLSLPRASQFWVKIGSLSLSRTQQFPALR